MRRRKTDGENVAPRGDPYDCAGGRTGPHADGRPPCASAYQHIAGARTISDAGPVASIVKHAQAYLDRPLVDHTGLTGNFERSVSFAFGANSAYSDAPSIFTAFQEQLGIRLEPRNAPLEVLITYE